MRYKYIFTFHTVDKHLVELTITKEERIDEVYALNALYRQGFMVGIRNYDDQVTLINMANVITAKVRIEEVY